MSPGSGETDRPAAGGAPERPIGRSEDRPGKDDGGSAAVDPVRLEVFRHLFASVADEMGRVLGRTAYSPNIKERRDFSCAVFDADARMAAQAAHIPVHLGSMPLSVRACVEHLDLRRGDVALLNDPHRGGTHLPDVTMVAPVDADGGRAGYVAARAHHADIGGATPGSLPLADELLQEGLVIPPVKLVAEGEIREDVRALVLANVRTPRERAGDLRAQLASVDRGRQRLGALAERHGRDRLARFMEALLGYAERRVRATLAEIPDGAYRFRDAMEDDGRGGGPAEIVVAVRVDGDRAIVDFDGTDAQRASGINAVLAITRSAVHYVVRSLVHGDVPSNAGCLAPVAIRAPEGTIVNARPPAAVAGGNVETSQRIVDVLLGALARACPDRVPAASQGTMNNVTIGGSREGSEGATSFAYYETLAGGAGAGPGTDGADAVHSHMTNTLNTPVEALEYAYPLRVLRYAVRRGSGGAGRWRGGDGVVRETELLTAARVTLLAERRLRRPWGLEGGEDGAAGRDVLVRDGRERRLPAKGSVDGRPGDVLRIETPGGGGWGKPPSEDRDRGAQAGDARTIRCSASGRQEAPR